MKIIFAPKGPMTEATSRYRGYLMAKALRAHGIDTEIFQLQGAWPIYKLSALRFREFIRCFQLLAKADSDTIFYLVRTIYRFDFILLVIVFKLVKHIRFVFDFDDPKYLEFPWKMRLLSRRANLIVVGSHALAEWAKLHNSHVVIIPTSVPIHSYTLKSLSHPLSNQPVTIGWIGIGPNHIQNIRHIIPALEKLAVEMRNIQIKLVGTNHHSSFHEMFSPLTALGVNCIFVPSIDWNDLGAIVRQLHTFDIGIMPLIDNEWNRAKCSFKAIEYMACGIPTVCSAVGENNYLIQSETNGILVKTEEEWYQALKRLINDEQLRNRIGAAGRVRIEKQYSIDHSATTLKHILQNLD